MFKIIGSLFAVVSEVYHFLTFFFIDYLDMDCLHTIKLDESDRYE